MLFPPGSLPEGPQFEQRKALLLLDLQNDFVTSNGKLYAANAASFLAKIPDLVKAFRDGGEVVWVRTEFRQSCPVLSPEVGGYCILLKQFTKNSTKTYDEPDDGNATPYCDDDFQYPFESADAAMEPDPEAFLDANIPDGFARCCLPSTDGAQYPEVLKAAIHRQKDILTTKQHYSAFADMSLLMQMRTRMVSELYICGSLSNISVYATALDAVRHGFQVTVVEDCLGYRDEACHLQAMRQMADNMGVEGIDCQELMDDLAGLLGDVVKEENFPTKFMVDTSRPSLAEKRSRSVQNINDWLDRMPEANEPTPPTEKPDARPVSSSSLSSNGSVDRKPIHPPSPGIESSPPRKRSVNDIDSELEISRVSRRSQQMQARRSSLDAYSRPDTRGKKTKVRIRRRNDIQGQSVQPETSTQQSLSTGDLPDNESAITPANITTKQENTSPATRKSKKPKNKPSRMYLNPDDIIGDGNSKIVFDVITNEVGQKGFEDLKLNVKWQKMYHRTGEVPRLVAVQGDIDISEDNSITYPVYRHPADESPELRPFSETVDDLRKICEKHIGHPLNHVLIQHYRNGEDNISEHSDKTLDIVRGSNIVNLSLGAMRTMTLRTKRADTSRPEPTTSTEICSSRTTQRIQLPHASLFILSSSTNSRYLHAIRADKRPESEKCESELDFGGERISLTFRNIGTFITDTSDGKQLIWGQGATSKERINAREVLKSINFASTGQQEEDKDRYDQEDRAKNLANLETEKMIIGFGKENHEGESFDWDAVYGQGFDVVNFVTKPIG